MGNGPASGHPMSPRAWQLQVALGACRAGRLLTAASLACTLFALAMLAGQAGQGFGIARVLWSLAVLAVLPALYLGVRLELDRALFQRLAEVQDANGDALAALDRGLAELGWKLEEGNLRPLSDRVRGVFRLVARLGGVVGVQLCGMLAAAVVT